jgi:phage tail-like protein
MSEDRTRREGPDGRFSQFNFLVDLGDGREGGFQEMSGLDEQVMAIDYRVSRSPLFSTQKMPSIAALGHVTLKRGAIAGGEGFRDWRQAVLLGRIEPRTIRVRLCDAQRGTVMTWTLAGARPTKIVGADGGAGAAEDVAIEALEIVCEGIAAAEG